METECVLILDNCSFIVSFAVTKFLNEYFVEVVVDSALTAMCSTCM